MLVGASGLLNFTGIGIFGRPANHS